MQSFKKKVDRQKKERTGALGTFLDRQVIWIKQLPKTKQSKKTRTARQNKINIIQAPELSKVCCIQRLFSKFKPDKGNSQGVRGRPRIGQPAYMLTKIKINLEIKINLDDISSFTVRSRFSIAQRKEKHQMERKDVLLKSIY